MSYQHYLFTGAEKVSECVGEQTPLIYHHHFKRRRDPTLERTIHFIELPLQLRTNRPSPRCASCSTLQFYRKPLALITFSSISPYSTA